MRPEKLIICGWGPYKEETIIDFSKFKNKNLFLITGQTGAGKTTVFDAMTYALYGVLSGEVREKASVRSDFATKNTKTFVQFTMTHRDREYTIYRNPEYLRPKKRKTKGVEYTKERETAAITMPDGSIIAGNNEVTETVTNIMGLDAASFKQISMIAQGDFSRMLLASPSEKTTIFREIFSTEIYAKMQNKLKEKSTELMNEYKIYHGRLEEAVHICEIEDEKWHELVDKSCLNYPDVMDYLSEKIEEIKKIKEKSIEENKKVLKELFALRECKAMADEINTQFSQYEELLLKIEKLQENEESIKETKERIKQCNKAQALAFLEKQCQLKHTERETLFTKKEKLQREIEKLKTSIEEAKPIMDRKEQIEDALVSIANLKESKEQLAEYQMEYEKLANQLEDLKQKYQESQKENDRKREAFETAQSNYRKAAVGIAAQMVKEGEPCPVCGSLHHPQIAKWNHGNLSEEHINELKEQYQAASELCNKLFESTLTQKKDTENKYNQIEAATKKKSEEEQKLQNLDDLVKEYIDSASQEIKDQFETDCMNYQQSSGTLMEKEKSLKELQKEEKECSVLEEQLWNEFYEAVKQAGFADKEQYHQVLTQLNTLEEMKQQVSDYEQEKATLAGTQKHLKDSLKGKEKQETTELTDKIKQYELQQESLENRIKENDIQLNQMERSLKGMKEKWGKCEQLSLKYGIVKDLDDLANGNNPKRLVFEQYVLAGYFERILAAANLRLKTMTDTRYELRRAKQVTDGRRKDFLEITVMDYYTGRERSIKTLSGGETFKASLALALGMSDCIQAQNGGVQIETLFIDEGFGALDEESLNQACNTLQSLAKNSKMIGIISHVLQLRERIEHQIVVEKHGNGGSYVRVI